MYGLFTIKIWGRVKSPCHSCHSGKLYLNTRPESHPPRHDGIFDFVRHSGVIHQCLLRLMHGQVPQEGSSEVSHCISQHAYLNTLWAFRTMIRDTNGLVDTIPRSHPQKLDPGRVSWLPWYLRPCVPTHCIASYLSTVATSPWKIRRRNSSIKLPASFGIVVSSPEEMAPWYLS